MTASARIGDRESTRSWSLVFSPSQRGTDWFCIEGTQYSHAGPDHADHPTFERVVAICEQFGFPYRWRATGAMIGASTNEHDFAFLDRGVPSASGHYFVGPRGA